jgi:hypothetical protein
MKFTYNYDNIVTGNAQHSKALAKFSFFMILLHD